ncbi:MAG TPA: tRNA (adenosine(37)-N6)-threonylcarbamoyltransferase complex ATPase subunit type 1 TsaE [bacterium]|nr:tRNA (adenosine(37)-N6)-threonylcarbamoyltransferase complex ATPase subunit type 1 TsaE [bacterium]HEX68527.1 tRNA (adenosine(37)-N6)-threonylcarbamoyltransferase complex ATPase subunit type 1 TsaE [bacterium]
MTILSKEIITSSPEKTLILGEKIGRNLKGGEFFVLSGPLGSGKTVFVKGLAKGLGVKDYEYVSSASFIILKIYKGRLPLYHFDLFRVEDFHELEDIGWEEYVKEEGVVVMEWGERFKKYWSNNYLEVNFQFGDGINERRIKFSSEDVGYKELFLILDLP